MNNMKNFVARVTSSLEYILQDGSNLNESDVRKALEDFVKEGKTLLKD